MPDALPPIICLQSVDICDVARKLGVSHVLEGSVRKAGGRVRINAQLIDGTTGDHIWDQKDVGEFLGFEPRLLRPLNYPDGAPGSGSIVLETPKGKVGVLNRQRREPICEARRV